MKSSIGMESVDQVRRYLDDRRPNEYQLVDVRQDWEYEEFHLPGALLMPLPDLTERLDELDKGVPVITYCRSGARSQAAAALLEGEDFQVSNMVGGILAWQGEVAVGPLDLGLARFSDKAGPEEILLTACAMEHHLYAFYVSRADLAETSERIGLFLQLADFEDRHIEVLHTRYSLLANASTSVENFVRKALAGSDSAVEGGMLIEDFLEAHGPAFEGDLGMIQLAMMIEAQAMDYYLRCSRAQKDARTWDLFYSLAMEERAHLKLLGRFMVPED